MKHDLPPSRGETAGGTEFQKAMSVLLAIVADGLRHGYFDGAVTIETRKTDKRELLIKAGKSHKFTIPLDEVPR